MNYHKETIGEATRTVACSSWINPAGEIITTNRTDNLNKNTNGASRIPSQECPVPQHDQAMESGSKHSIEREGTTPNLTSEKTNNARLSQGGGGLTTLLCCDPSRSFETEDDEDSTVSLVFTNDTNTVDSATISMLSQTEREATKNPTYFSDRIATTAIRWFVCGRLTPTIADR